MKGSHNLLAPGSYINGVEIIRFAGTQSRKQKYECRCYCGDTFTAYKSNLVSGRTKSCPACARGRDLRGLEIKGWRAEQRAGKSESGDILWYCRCMDCGTTIIASGILFKQGKLPVCHHEKKHQLSTRETDEEFFQYK